MQTYLGLACRLHIVDYQGRPPINCTVQSTLRTEIPQTDLDFELMLLPRAPNKIEVAREIFKVTIGSRFTTTLIIG